MITILISVAANAAIGTSLPKGAQASPAGVCGGFCLTINLETIDRLTAVRRLGESYSDVILRLTTAGEAALEAPPYPQVTTDRPAFQHGVAGALYVADKPVSDNVCPRQSQSTPFSPDDSPRNLVPRSPPTSWPSWIIPEQLQAQVRSR